MLGFLAGRYTYRRAFDSSIGGVVVYVGNIDGNIWDLEILSYRNGARLVQIEVLPG